MIPRGKLDITSPDIFAGIRYCISERLYPQKIKALADEISLENDHDTDHGSKKLLCLSVRTGFDLVLSALNLPPGTEILVTNINIPDMFNIIAAHQLIAVPLVINKHTLSITPEQIEAAITPAAKVLLITHLFGGIMESEKLLEVAKRNNLLVIEDWAQAFRGNEAPSAQTSADAKPSADVKMFSFGLIKTNTAISGAMLQVSSPELYAKVYTLNELLPKQETKVYLKKLFKISFLNLIIKRFPYTLFYQLIKARGKDFDQVLSGFTRGFPGKDPLKKIRYRPCDPNKLLIEKRLKDFSSTTLRNRTNLANDILKNIPENMQIGTLNQAHTYWILPIATETPEVLIEYLRSHGFDGTSKASSLIKLETSPGKTPVQENELSLQKLVYLPMDLKMTAAERNQLGILISDFH